MRRSLSRPLPERWARLPYTTVKLAFDAINAGTHQGAITIDITANTTEGTTPATLNSSGAGSASYTSVLLRPTADGVSVSGNPAAGFGVIQLKGADNVTIDGDNPNTGGINRNLTVANTAVATVIGNSVIRIANATTVVTSSDNNTIKNCILNGNVTSGNAVAITSATGSSGISFGIYVGGNGGTTAIDAPTAITSATTQSAPTGTTVNNLLIDNNSVNQCSRAIQFNGAVATVSTGVTISNNVIGDQGAATPATPPFTAPATTVYTKGIWVAGTAAVTVSGNTLKNIISYVSTTITSIEMVSPVTAPTITNNTITNVANNGTVSIVKALLVSSSTGAYSIARNNITNVQTLAGASGTDAIEVTAAAPSGTIEQNKVTTVNSRSAGTFGAYGINLTAGTGIIVKNNFVSDVTMNMTGGGAFSTTFSVHGIRIAGGTGHKVYHNSVNLFGLLAGTSTTTILTSGLCITSTSISGLDVRNNILSNTITGGTTSIAHVSLFLPTNTATAMGLTNNNNDYFSGADAARQGIAQANTTAGTGFYLASNFNPGATTPSTNLRALTTTLGTATNDDSSKVVDPLFVSSTDLHIAVASPMVDMGASVGVTNDIDGQTRVPPPDIGADEPSGITPPANDIAATAITTPANGSTFGIGAVVTPQATFTNAGTATQTGVMVQFTITGPGGYSYADTQTIATIAPNQTVTVTFAPAPAFTTAGTYNTAATVTTPDANAANDQVTGSFTVIAPLSGPYNVPGDYPSLTNAGGIFAALNAAGATGNITINIAGDLTGETGANALNELAGGFTVLIKPSGAARTISGTTTALGLIILNGTDNVTIDGSLTGGTDRSLTINDANTGAADIWIRSASASNGATGNTVKNCNLTGPAANAIAGILAGGNTFGTAADAPNSNNTVQNNLVTRVQNALFLSGNAATFDQNWLVTGNTFGSTVAADKLSFRGMLLGGANNFTITQNTIMGVVTASSSTATGIQLSANATNGSVTRNNISDIKNNNGGGFGANGIFLAQTSTTANVTVANNFIRDVAGVGFSGIDQADNGYGIVVASGGGYKIFFNSVNLVTNETAAGSITSGLNILAAVTTAASIDLRDNILSDQETVGTRYGVINASTQGAAVFLDTNYNDYFAQNVGRQGATTFTTLAAWQGATLKDANSKAVDPMFVSATDLHLQTSSPLVGMGIAIGGITTDIDGDTRPAVPAIGADDDPTYTVTYNGNTNTGGTAPVDSNSYVAGATVTVLGPGTLTKTGYTFAHWNTAANDSGTSYNPGDTFTMPAANVTLFAQWTVNSYTVTYDGNANTGGTAPVDPNSPYTFGSTVTVLGPGTLTKTGYTFAHWNTAANDSGTSYNPGDTFTMPAANVTLFAQWTINTYTVTYDGNTNTGGTAPVDPNSPYTFGSTVTVLGPGTLTKTGYTFSHWNTAANDSGTSYNPGDTFTMPAANVTLFAQWTINSYTVTYDGNTNTGGTAPVDPNSPYTFGSTVTVLGPGTLTKTGYTFAHWNTAADNSGTSYNPGDTFTMPAANVTLFAQWTINGPVTVSGSTGADGNYPSLTQAGGAFAAINAAGSQAGNNIVVTILSDVLTEDGTNSLNNGGWTTLTVNPVGARTLSGSVAGPLINLNGASNVTIDGSGGPINASINTVRVAPPLTISNTNTGRLEFRARCSCG